MNRTVTIIAAFSLLITAEQARSAEPFPPDSNRTEPVAYLDATLRTVMDDLSARFDTTLVLDEREWKDLGISPDDKVTFAEQRLTLSAALDQILRPRKLDWRPKTYVLYRHMGYITTLPLGSCQGEFPAVYKVTGKLSGQELAEKIQREVEPNSWRDSGVGSGQIKWVAKPFLVIENQEYVHRQLATKLPDLIKPAYGEVMYPPESLAATLRQRQSLHWQGKPLSEALRELQQSAELKIDCDADALSSAGISPQSKVTLNVRRLPIESILALSARQIGATYRVADERVVIGPRSDDDANMKPIKREYDVRDLLPFCENSEDTFCEIVTATICANYWREMGGGAQQEIEFVRPGQLAVEQVADVHQELEQFFADIRATLK